MSFSTLYRIATPPMRDDGLGGAVRDVSQYVVGTATDGSVWIHGQPGTAPIAPLEVLRDGTAAWTWGEIASHSPALTAILCPHRWDEEPTDVDVVPTEWALLAPPLPSPES